MRALPLVAGTILVLGVAVALIPSVLVGPDEPIPAGQAATVAAARTALQANVDGAGGLRFTRMVCTADGGAMVVFEMRGLLSSGGTMTALTSDVADPTRWWGGIGTPDDPDAVVFLADHPATACA